MTKNIKHLVIAKMQRGFDIAVADFVAQHPNFNSKDAELLAKDLMGLAEEAAGAALQRLAMSLKAEEALNNPVIAY